MKYLFGISQILVPIDFTDITLTRIIFDFFGVFIFFNFILSFTFFISFFLSIFFVFFGNHIRIFLRFYFRIRLRSFNSDEAERYFIGSWITINTWTGINAGPDFEFPVTLMGKDLIIEI